MAGSVGARAAGLAAALCLGPLAPVASPGPARPPAILLVDPGDGGRPAFPELTSGLRERLRDEGDAPPVSIYTVNLDVASLASPAARRALDSLVAERYGARPIGALVAFREPTFDAAFAWRDRHWPATPVVAVADSDAAVRRLAGRANCSVLHVEMGGRGTLKAALRLLPDTERIVFVGGREFLDSPGEDGLGWMREEGPTLEALVGLPLPQILTRVAALPPRSIVLFGGLTSDGEGRQFASRDALDRIAARASAPVFVTVSTFVGRGVLGGDVVDFSAIGRRIAEAALRLLRGEPPAAGVETPDVTRLVFDHRELDRWKVDRSAVPPGATVLFRPPTMWEEHRGKVAAGLVIGFAQTFAIGALLLQIRRRRQAEDGLRRLSARLMTAQEGERRRIARDLHDDVCQRLVLMALDLDLLGGGEDGPDRGGDAERRTPGEVADSARALSADVQRIAYELHPASLDRLGLVHAVQRFAREATARTDVRVDTVIQDWPERELPREVTLALYRAVQEGLQNVVRHAGATRARVSLHGGRDGVAVTIEDDGRGFDPALEGDRGLGLIGMRERLQLQGGRLAVTSAPGEGTVVRAWVPAATLRATAPVAEPAPPSAGAGGARA